MSTDVTKKKRRKVKNKRAVAFRILLASVLASLAMMLLCTFVISVVHVDVSNMSKLKEGDIVITLQYSKVESGDTIAFYQGNHVLFRRVIGTQGDWISIAEDGTVTVNTEVLDEPYVTNQMLGNSDITYPYHVPASRYFVLADNREVMTDSRVALVGSISQKQLIGEAVFRIWPLTRIGFIS